MSGSDKENEVDLPVENSKSEPSEDPERHDDENKESTADNEAPPSDRPKRPWQPRCYRCLEYGHSYCNGLPNENGFQPYVSCNRFKDNQANWPGDHSRACDQNQLGELCQNARPQLLPEDSLKLGFNAPAAANYPQSSMNAQWPVSPKAFYSIYSQGLGHLQESRPPTNLHGIPSGLEQKPTKPLPQYPWMRMNHEPQVQHAPRFYPNMGQPSGHLQQTNNESAHLSAAKAQRRADLAKNINPELAIAMLTSLNNLLSAILDGTDNDVDLAAAYGIANITEFFRR